MSDTTYVYYGSLSIAVLLGMVIGVRLVWLGRETHGAPELMWGLAWVLFGANNLLEVAVNASADKALFYGAYLVVYALCALAVWVAAWRIFRPQSRGALGMCFVVGAVLVGSCIYQAAGPGFGLEGVHGLNTPGQWVTRTLSAAGLLWVALEAFRCSAAYRKRQRFGLASPLAAARFLLWGVSAAALFLLMVSVFLAALDLAPFWITVVGQPLFGLLGMIAMWMAFFPPAAMRRLLAAGAVS